MMIYEFVIFRSVISPHKGNDGQEFRESEEEEFPELMSPMSSKRLKVSDINISRYHIIK